MRPLLAGLFLFALGGVALAEGSSYAMDVDVVPDASGRANAYQCNVVITDLETSTPIMMPKIALLTDTDAKLSTTLGDRHYALTIRVDSKASRTTAQLTVTRAGKVIAEQKTSMAVPR